MQPGRPAGLPRLPGGLVWAFLGAAATLALAALVLALVSLAHRSPAATSRITPTFVPRSPTPRAATAAPSPTQPPPTATGRPLPTATPVLTPTPRPADVYMVNFDTIFTGWEEDENADVRRYYANGQYHILVKSSGMTAWNTSGRNFQDFSLEVETTQVAGPDDNGYGVLLRHVDDDNFYYFEISGDGYWEFSKQEDDEWVTLIKWTEASAIKQGKATNVIKVICDAAAFDFYVNNTQVGDYFDGTFTEGDIGLSVSAYSAGGVHIAFDNLTVRPLK
jgi:hypothetical protein